MWCEYNKILKSNYNFFKTKIAKYNTHIIYIYDIQDGNKMLFL